MAVTGIVISIAGLVYNMLGQQFHSYRETNESIAVIFRLNNMLSADFSKAALINRAGEGMEIERNDRGLVEYIFSGKDVLRIEADHTDTFRVSIDEAHFLFKQEEQVLGMIDELYFDVVVFEDRERLHFTKAYGIDAEINSEEESGGN